VWLLLKEKGKEIEKGVGRRKGGRERGERERKRERLSSNLVPTKITRAMSGTADLCLSS
jgi:hypothetical protein